MDASDENKVSVEEEEINVAVLEKERIEKEIREQKRLENISKVDFLKPVVKDIVSANSGCILAKEGPLVPLSTAMEAEARAVFQAASTDSLIPTSLLSDLLVRCGATPACTDAQREGLEVIVKKQLKGEENEGSWDEDAFVAFVSKFHTPAYQYGQRLRRSAGRGLVEDVLGLLNRGCSVNTADGEGLTSLHYACEFNRLSVIDALVDFAGEMLIINAKDKFGWTPLHCAIHHGNPQCAEKLLSLGALVGVGSIVGKTPLHAAAAQGRLEIAEMLLAKEASAAQIDDFGMTPLHEAAFKAQRQMYALLESTPSADKSIRDKLGNLASDYLGSFRTDGVHDISLEDEQSVNSQRSSTSQKSSKSQKSASRG